LLVGSLRFHVRTSISGAGRDGRAIETPSVGDETARLHTATNGPAAIVGKAGATAGMGLALLSLCQRYHIGKEDHDEQGRIVVLHDGRFLRSYESTNNQEDFMIRMRFDAAECHPVTRDFHHGKIVWLFHRTPHDFSIYSG
jgi:hypothetical protein